MSSIYKIRMIRHSHKNKKGELTHEGKEFAKEKGKKFKDYIDQTKSELIYTIAGPAKRVKDTAKIYTDFVDNKIGVKEKDYLGLDSLPDEFNRELNERFKTQPQDEAVQAFLNGEFKIKPIEVAMPYLKKLRILRDLLEKKHKFEKNQIVIAATHQPIIGLLPVAFCGEDLPAERKELPDFVENLDFDFQKNESGEVKMVLNFRGIQKEFEKKDLEKLIKNNTTSLSDKIQQ